MNKTVEDWGKLLHRVTIAGLLLMHGIAKLSGDGIVGIERQLDAHGLPTWIAYGVYLGEVLAPLLVIVGAFARPAAAVMAINMLMAIFLAHSKDLFSVQQHGGSAVEVPLLYLSGSLVIVLLGAGRIAWQPELRKRHDH